MPTNKDLKRLVRERMDKTGERYTTAHDAVTNGGAKSPDGLAPDLIKDAHRRGATDIHLDPTADGLVVRFRVGERLREVQTFDITTGRGLVEVLRKVAGTDGPGTGPAEGRIEINVDEQPVSLRLNVLPGVHGEHVNLRFVDAQRDRDLAALGYSAEDIRHLYRVCRNNGLLAIEHAGPGLPRVLEVLVDALDHEQHSVIAIGPDPIDRPAIVRVRTGPELNLPEAMQSALRSDPDVFVIDRLTSDWTFNIAQELADTGHVVLAIVEPGALPRAGVVATVVTPTAVIRPD